MKRLVLKEEPIFKEHQISPEERIYKVIQKSKVPLSHSLAAQKSGMSNGGSTTEALRTLIRDNLIKKENCPSCGTCVVYSLLKS